MKRNTILSLTLFLALTTLILAACTAPTAAPTEIPTMVPATQAPAATATQPVEATAYPLAESTPDTEAGQADDAYPVGGEIQLVLVPDQSQARYIVTEQLVGRDLPNDVVGTTNQIAGAVYLNTDGTIDAARSKFIVQAGTLVTDESRRDGFVRSNTLQTDLYPEIVFVPTAVSGLSDPLVASGEVSFILTGQLTIRDVTKEVTWEVTGSIDGDTAKGTAKTVFQFADFNLTQPKVPVVLSIKDEIHLEMDVVLQREGN